MRSIEIDLAKATDLGFTVARDNQDPVYAMRRREVAHKPPAVHACDVEEPVRGREQTVDGDDALQT